MSDSVLGSDLDPPFIEYTGTIEYHTDFFDIAVASDNLLQWVEQLPAEPHQIPIAFDMEWPFNFKTGSGKTAVIQLCANVDRCYVFQVSKLSKLPYALLALLYHPRVCLHGVNIVNDFRKLKRDFPTVKADILIAQCKDLGSWFNSIGDTSGRWSLERLVMQICRLRINKDKKIRMSRWDTFPLSKDQQLYAAIDVYISQVIYIDLLKSEAAKKLLLEEISEFENIILPETTTNGTTNEQFNNSIKKPKDDVEKAPEIEHSQVQSSQTIKSPSPKILEEQNHSHDISLYSKYDIV